MTFYVLGNGFDLHYGLPTRYCDFKKYLIINGYREIVERVDDLFWRFGHYCPKDIKEWSTFEDMLMVFNDLDPDELYEEAFDNAETDDDRAGYWDSPSWNVNFYNEYIKVLKGEFDNWIREMNTEIIPDRYFNPVPGDAVLTFNYTTTVEDNFDTRGIQITHIHGTKNQEIVLGHNDVPNPNLYNVIEDEDSDYRDTTTRNAINDVLAQASQNYYKDSVRILQRNSRIFSQISRFNKVVIMGLSCGLQDEMYVEEIIRYASTIDFYYYDDDAKENFDDILDNYNVTVNYYKW
ncbi:MAG: hypothetical protein IJW99_02125 [Clostridia bacterium]|nr:hypothetical protein [Clostridia bacterium]